jgi:LPS-assembly protein
VAQAGPALAAVSSTLPDDPGQEILPVAVAEPQAATGSPARWDADRQDFAGDLVTLTGHVVFHYRDYVLTASKVTYNRATTELKAEGPLEVTGGPNDVRIEAERGEMRLDNHTARFYKVSGSQGVRGTGRTAVYSTANPVLFSARLMIENGEGNYRIEDGSITNCRLPNPDWRIVARSFVLENGEARATNSIFELFTVPVFDMPYLRHAMGSEGRESGFLIPVVSNGSSIRGYTFGEQAYVVINRSMDMILGTEYFSKRGWAPNGDFRYRGAGLDHILLHWNSLVDRGYKETTSSGVQLVNQGGVDVSLEGTKDLTDATRFGGVAEYLSSYVYRLVFDDNYSQATSSQVTSDLALAHTRNGIIRSVGFQRFETFASVSNGNEVRILHLPNLRYDVLDRPLGNSRAYWGFGSSLGYMGRSEPSFHSRNVGRLDLYPHIALPVEAGGWSFTFEGALRDTAYTISQLPDLIPHTGQIPTISHDPLNRVAAEATVDIRPPVLERDYEVGRSIVLRHTIEPELTYRYVGGVGAQQQNVLLFDTTDVLSDTNEGEYSLTQRLFVRNKNAKPCDAASGDECPPEQREWASWQLAQKAFWDPYFGGAVFRGRRNVYETTLDLSAVAFLTRSRNLSPVISRMRFEAIPNLRVEWDLDYDSVRGLLSSDNLYAGYSAGRTTFGVGHALLNAVDENSGTADRILKSQILTPFLEIGKMGGAGFNMAAHVGYDFDQDALQYGGLQASYNWNCCGLTMGFRRFVLGAGGTSVRDETQWLYSFTIASFGNVGDIRRSNMIFRDPKLPPIY